MRQEVEGMRRRREVEGEQTDCIIDKDNERKDTNRDINCRKDTTEDREDVKELAVYVKWRTRERYIARAR